MKRLLVVLLSVFVAVSLAGCSSDKEQGKNKDKEKPRTEEKKQPDEKKQPAGK